MQIVIDIKEEDYRFIHEYKFVPEVCILSLGRAIYNGTPLPKGHGDLIDRNKIEYMKAIHDLKYGEITASECATKIKYSAPTIIEADKEREE